MPQTSALAQTLAAQLEGVAGLSISPDARMVEATVREMIASLKGDLTTDDLRLYSEMQGLSDTIRKMRQEIAALNPTDLTHSAIPTATDELEAVVLATEEATGRILDAAEQISQIATALDNSPHAAALTDAVTTIFEASNFQDITGQRITKVVKTLQVIEARIAGMLTVFGLHGAGGGQPTAAVSPAAAPATATKVADDPQNLMNGPQLPGNAVSQDDIDALFDSL